MSIGILTHTYSWVWCTLYLERCSYDFLSPPSLWSILLEGHRWSDHVTYCSNRNTWEWKRALLISICQATAIAWSCPVHARARGCPGYRGLQRAVLEAQQPKCGLTHGQGQALGEGKVGEKAPGAPNVLLPHSWARHSGLSKPAAQLGILALTPSTLAPPFCLP